MEILSSTWMITILHRGYPGHFHHKDTQILGTWSTDSMLRVLTQYTNFEQNFNLGSSPVQDRETGSGKTRSSVTLDSRALSESSIRPPSPMKAQREQVARTEKQSISTVNHTKEAKAFLWSRLFDFPLSFLPTLSWKLKVGLLGSYIQLPHNCQAPQTGPKSIVF